jgi:hypothetical protein
VKERYYLPPATAAEIRRAVGATPEDIAAVNKVLRELGHPTIPLKVRPKPGNGGDSPSRTRARKTTKKAKQSAATR